MEQLKFDVMKSQKNNLYPDNRISKYKKKNNTEINPYPKYSKQENQVNIKNLNFFNSNNPIIQDINQKNNDKIIKDNKSIMNYYSFPTRMKNSRVINSNKDHLMEQYSLRSNYQNNYYSNNLQKKRNTYDYQDKNIDIKNIIYSDFQKLNTSGIDDYNELFGNINFDKVSKNNNNISKEKKLLFNKLNSSKSTNDFFIEDDHDISIEYNNPPIIPGKNSNRENYINTYKNEKNGYMYPNSRIKNINELSRDINIHSNDNSRMKDKNNKQNKKINYTSFISNDVDKSGDTFDKKYFDINISNIDKNYGYVPDEENYEYLLSQEKKPLDKSSNIKEKFNKNDYRNPNNYNYNTSLDLYQMKNNKIFEFNNNINNHNLSHKGNKTNKVIIGNLSTIKKKNIEIINQNISKKNLNNNNNKLVDIKNRNASTLNNFKNNNNNKNNNISNRNYKSNTKPELKKCHKSKKDIFINKDYYNMVKFNNIQQKITSSSPSPNDNLNQNSKTYDINFNKKRRIISNNNNSDKMNMKDNNQKNNNNIYEIVGVKYVNNSNQKNKNPIHKNLTERQKALQHKNDNINSRDTYNSIDIHNNEVSNIQCNINLDNNYLQKSLGKKSNLTEYYNYKENLNYYESKHDSSRYNNSKIENSNQNLIFSAGSIGNGYKRTSNFGHKSTKNLKNENKILNVICDRKKMCNSPSPPNNNQNNINIMNNKNIINNNYKNVIIKLDNYNSCDPKLPSNKKEESKLAYKTDFNINNNNEFLKNENKKYNNNINLNNNEDSCSLLKSINYNKPLNNVPVKLYSKRNEIENNKNNNKTIYKDNKEPNDKNHINNNYQSQMNFKSNNNKIIKKYNSTSNYNKTNLNNNNNIHTKNHNVININTNTSNINVLNVKNSAINILIEKSEKFNILSPEKNINLASSYGHKEHSSNYRNNKNNVKDVANELFEKNRNFKNLKILKPSINKTSRINNYLNNEIDPSLMKISTNTIRYNNKLQLNINNTDNNTKSSNNIFTKNNNNNIIENHKNNEKNDNNINNKKPLILNNSEALLFSKKKLNKEYSKAKIRNVDKIISNTIKEYSNTNLDKSSLSNLNEYINVKDNINSDIQYNLKNFNSFKDKRVLMKPIKSPNQENDNKNLINYYRSINIPLVSPNNSVQINALNNNTNNNNNNKSKKKNNSPSGVYIKPYCILSMSKPKKNITKSKSELKMSKNSNNKSNNKNITVTSLKKSKTTSKSLSSEMYFNTSPTFHQKDELLKSNLKSNPRESGGSVNTSTITKNISTINLNENEKDQSIDNNKYVKISTIINSQINNIRDNYTKSYCFFYKICKYFIKPPKVEVCHFIKNGVKNNSNMPIKTNNGKMSIIQEVLISNNNIDEEKNNESSQNGLLMTFGDVNYNNKKIDKSNMLINSNSKNNNYIGDIIDNIIEDSDLDLYKSLQQVSQNKNDKISNDHTSSNIINSENEDLKIYESLEKDKNSNQNLNHDLYKSTTGKEVDDEEIDDKKSKTFKKSSKYNLKNAEKGLKILGKIASRRGIKTNDDNLSDVNNCHNGNMNKKNEKIYLGTNKLNELFNSRRETESSNIDQKSDDNSNIKNKIKVSKSVNKEIMKGITKIENVLEKNSINSFDINSIENKINTYDKGNKINNESNSNENMYNGYIDYSEILKSKMKTYVTKSKTNLGSSNENNTFDSYLDIINNNENEKFPRYRESEILLNKHKLEVRNSRESKDYNLPPIKKNLLNEDMFNNHCSDLLSFSGEEIKINKYDNIEYNLEEFETYLKDIKNKQGNNSIKYDLIYLLNILVEKNYSNILNQITKIILYKNSSNNNNKNNNYILNNNNDIIENEHLFKNIIFRKVSKESKYIFLYANLCNDLSNNISNSLSEQKNIKNNKDRNLKLIINDEFVTIFNNFKNSKKILINDKENIEYYLLKRKIIGYTTFIYELINLELLKQQFGLYALEQFYKIYNDNNFNNIIRELYLEAILILLNKFGKLVFENNNKKLIQNINNYMNNNLQTIINNNQNNNEISKYFRYKIMNLITKRDNQWKDTVSDIIENEEKNKNFPLNVDIKNNDLKYKDNYANKIWNKEINIDDVNSSIIEEDLINYISYYTEENNNGQINIKNNIDKSYNWKIIDELINDQNFGLESIINYFIKVCTNIINDDNQILISNDYIRNIIEYYANNLPKKSIDSIHNEMIKTFLTIDEIINKNKNMYKILGHLLFILIDNKLYHIKYFNNYLKAEKQTQINLAIITRYCIISSGKFAKKYLNDFKQTKLFLNNEIFIEYVNEALKDLLYFIQ